MSTSNGLPARGHAWRVIAAAAAMAVVLTGCETTPPAPGAPQTAAEAETSELSRRARIRLDLAASYYQQRNFVVAIEEVRQALALDPRLAAAHGLLGLIHMELGERDKAEASFQRGLAVAPDDSELNNNYGWFLCNTGRERESVSHFLKAVQNPLYQTPSRPLHNAGICSLRLGDEAAGESYLRRAFQIDAANPVAMYQLASLYLKRGDVEQAGFYSDRLLKLYEPTAETLWLALRVARLANDQSSFASLATQLRRRFPASPETELLRRERYE